MRSATSLVYSDSERVACVVDGAPVNAPGSVGGSRLFIVEPGEPTELPIEARDYMMNHMAYTGLVDIEVTKTKDGTHNDLEKAKVESQAKLKEFDEIRYRKWVTSSIDDYIKRNKPVPPPDDAILKIINRRQLDPKKFGIVPIGWEDPEKTGRVAQLESENNLLKTQLSDLSSKLDLLTTIVAQQQQPGVVAANTPKK